jgi:hypothetical protein
MIHELRVFHCVPGRLPALLKRFETDTLGLFDKHGIKQVGFWTVAIGESNNDLFLILQWESLAERERKFGAFLKDPEWLEARRKSEEDGPIDASITNTILVPTTFSSKRQLIPTSRLRCRNAISRNGVYLSTQRFRLE